MGPTVCSSLEDLLLNSVLMRSPPKPAERAPPSPLPMKPVDIFTSLPMLSMQPGSDLMVSPGLRFFVRMGYRRPNLRRRAERQRRRRRGVGNGGGGGANRDIVTRAQEADSNAHTANAFSYSHHVPRVGERGGLVHREAWGV